MPRGKKETPNKAAEQAPKKPGRKPLTDAQKAEKIRKENNMVPTLVLQYQGSDVELQALIEQAKVSFKEKHKRTRITDMRIYLKPEEHTAYFVINEAFEEKIAF